MLCANIKQIEKHDYLAERFKKGYDFLKNTDLMSLPVGRVDIDGDDVFASVQEYITLPEAECRYEAHDKYYDIQYVAAGREKFGCVKREGENPKYESFVVLEAGDCVVVAPEEAHKPKGQAGEPARVRKIVVKVRV